MLEDTETSKNLVYLSLSSGSTLRKKKLMGAESVTASPCWMLAVPYSRYHF